MNWEGRRSWQCCNRNTAEIFQNAVWLTWNSLSKQIASGTVGRVHKQGQPEPDQLEEGQACGKEAMPVEIAQGEECLEEVTGLHEL